MARGVFTGRWERLGQPTDVLEPATGRVISRIGLIGGEQVARSAAAARQAQRGWVRPATRIAPDILRRAANWRKLHRGEIVDWIVRESGSVRAKAEFELGITVRSLREAAAMPSQAQGLVLPSGGDRISLCRRLPLGVIGVIAPFNFPLYLAMRAVAPALAVGNAVVLKPDPRTSISGGVIIAQLFAEAGLPEGVLHVLPGAGDAGAALCSDPNIAMIAFTGSTSAGRKVGELAGRHLKKVSLELGGKNTLMVLDDADLDIAVSNAAWGTYLHQGQICMASGRILVQRTISEEFTGRLAEKARTLPVGDPATSQVALGPLINRAQIDQPGTLSIARRRPVPSWKPVELMRASSSRRRCSAGLSPGWRLSRRRYLARSRPSQASRRTTRRSPWQIRPNMACPPASFPVPSAGRWASAIGSASGCCTSTIKRSPTTSSIRSGVLARPGNGTSIGGPANWEEFTQWQWVTIRGRRQHIRSDASAPPP